MCNNDNNERNGIVQILNVILVLQENACPDSCLDSCDRPMLGGGVNCLICNTRPVMIYTCSGAGTPLRMSTTKDVTTSCDGVTDCSTVFRIEKIEGNCATFRVLAENPDPTSLNPYVTTNSFFTIDCGCICIIKCLSDTYIECA